MALTKPFDSLNHELLLTKLSLLNCVGCVVKWVMWVRGLRGPVAAWFTWVKNFLRGSTYYVGHNFTWVAWVNFFAWVNIFCVI